MSRHRRRRCRVPGRIRKQKVLKQLLINEVTNVLIPNPYILPGSKLLYTGAPLSQIFHMDFATIERRVLAHEVSKGKLKWLTGPIS